MPSGFFCIKQDTVLTLPETTLHMPLSVIIPAVSEGKSHLF